MSQRDRYVIERRIGGVLTLTPPQPHESRYFGMAAILGITEDHMARVIFRYHPDAVLTGTNIPEWPAYIHPDFVARRMTW